MIITDAALNAAINHALGAPHQEVCGVLTRTMPGLRPGYMEPPPPLIDGYEPMRNVAEHPAHRYELDPGEQLQVWQALEDAGRHVLAICHSHTTTSAQPSPTDIRYATDPSLLHMIISLAGIRPLARLFSIRRGVVVQQPLTVVEVGATLGLDSSPVNG